MLASLLRRPWLLGVALVAVVALLVGGAVAVFGGGGAPAPAAAAGVAAPTSAAPAITEVNTAGITYAPTLVVYNGRSHYGDEKVFRDFEAATGVTLELRGGTGPELFERLEREGADTPADVYVTTDLANLWRAEQAGLLQGVTSPTLRAQIPESRRDVAGNWWALSTRLRVPVYSTERVPAGAVTSYESLGDPRFRGRTCLRTSNNEYNQSLVADMIAKRGREATATLLRSWMANQPRIINSDGELLAGDRQGRLRRRPGQPLLPRPRSSRTTPTSPSRPRGPTSTARARTPTSPGSGSSRARRTCRRPWR